MRKVETLACPPRRVIVSENACIKKLKYLKKKKIPRFNISVAHRTNFLLLGTLFFSSNTPDKNVLVVVNSNSPRKRQSHSP